MPDDLARCLTPRELAHRWRCRTQAVRAMIRTGKLGAIVIGGRMKIAPEEIVRLETGPLAVRPRQRKRREMIPKEVRELLDS